MKVAARRGFTLVEVLVGLAIMALLLGLIQGIYSASVKNRNASMEKTAGFHAASTLLNRLCDELANSYFDKARPDQTKFLLVTNSTGNAALEFSTIMPPVHGLRPGGETRVRYETAQDRDAGFDGAVLVKRTELGDQAKNLANDGVTYEMMKGVAVFRVEVFNGELWIAQWDGKTPTAVKLTVTWGAKGAEESMTTTQTVYGVQ